MEKIKSTTIIYNPKSSHFNFNELDDLEYVLKKKKIKDNVIKSTNPHDVNRIIKDCDDYDNLIITIGGDGTVSNCYKALNEINQKGIYTHIPRGTTNDMASNYNVIKKDAKDIIMDALNGEITYFDSYKVNDCVAAYVSAFGKFTQIPYTANFNFKKNFGHAAYVLSSAKDFLTKNKKYLIEYNIDGEKGFESCVLGIVSNSKKFGGVSIYPNANLNDEKIEILLLKDLKPSLVKVLFKDYLNNTIDIEKYKDYVFLASGKNIKLQFKQNYPKYPVDIDGENSHVLPTFLDDKLEFEIAKKIRVLKNK